MMNVVREDVDALNAILKITVKSEDYQQKVDEILKDYRKKVNMPGFRPGHVPKGLIQKQYGKSVLLDELNRIVNSTLQSYLAENKVEILGNPIPKANTEVEGDFNKPGDFEFTYQIGLAPEFKVALSKKNKFSYVKVKVDKALIDKQIDDLRRRYGKLVSSEEVNDKDLVLAQFVELNEDETIMEGGILHSSTVSMEFVNDKKVAKALKGQKSGFKMVIDPISVSRGGKDTAAMLGIDEGELDSVSNKFQLTITEIRGMELAELNAELFEKLFSDGGVTDEKTLRERVKSDLAGMFVNDSDRMLTRNVYEELLEKTKMDLPDEFLKRWIKLSNEKEISEEEIERDYESYAKSLKWQLIQGNIFKSNDIKLENEEVIEYTKGLLVSNYAQYGMPAPEDAELTTSAMELLKNQEEANRVYDMLAEQKLTAFFKESVKLTDKEVSYDEFVELVAK